LYQALIKYRQGLERCPNDIHLLLLSVDCEERLHGAVRARPALDLARAKHPNSPDVWLASLRLEARAGETARAENLLARALKQLPDSGLLWAELVDMAPPNQRKVCGAFSGVFALDGQQITLLLTFLGFQNIK